MKKVLSFALVLCFVFVGCSSQEQSRTAGVNSFPLETEKINTILSDNGLPMEAVEMEVEGIPEDVKNNYYNLFDTQTQQPHGMVITTSGRKGTSVSFSYWAIVSDYFLDEAKLPQALNTAFDLHGGIKDRDTVLQQFEQDVANRSYISDGSNIYHWYTVGEEWYFYALFRAEGDGVPVFAEFIIMDENVFKEYLTANHVNAWAQQIYRREFE